jgi:hypothetical protein
MNCGTDRHKSRLDKFRGMNSRSCNSPDRKSSNSSGHYSASFVSQGLPLARASDLFLRLQVYLSVIKEQYGVRLRVWTCSFAAPALLVSARHFGCRSMASNLSRSLTDGTVLRSFMRFGIAKDFTPTNSISRSSLPSDLSWVLDSISRTYTSVQFASWDWAFQPFYDSCQRSDWNKASSSGTKTTGDRRESTSSARFYARTHSYMSIYLDSGRVSHCVYCRQL